MILVDAHVHLYDCFDLEICFSSAYLNFNNEAERLGQGNDFVGILLLAETPRDKWFHHLSENAEGKRLPCDKETGGWKFYRTGETGSLYARSDDNRRLFVIAGQQFVTREGLEVLALATTHSFPEGLPIEKATASVRDAGGIPVVPWGFGKWLGRRGAVWRSCCMMLKTEISSWAIVAIVRPSSHVLHN